LKINEIGSIEIGKRADLLLIDLNSHLNSVSDNDDHIYSDIVYSSGVQNVNSVMINGRWIVKDGESLVYDKNNLISGGQSELKNVLNRL